MKVLYDTSAKVAGIAIVPFSRLGPERWFENYTVVSYHPWDIANIPGSPRLLSLGSATHPHADLEKINTSSLLADSDFRLLLADKLKGYNIHTYKAVTLTDALKAMPVKFNGVDPVLREKIENKAEFRNLFSDRVRMPQYRIYEYRELRSGVVSFSDIVHGRDVVVLQDEQLSDGKGTFVIRTETDLREALAALDDMPAERRVVISDFVANKHERSVQCCVTKYGIFVGPLQKQIIADPLLTNVAIPGSPKFCGAEISQSDVFADSRNEIVGYAHIIGEALREQGYKGIFGIDCLVSENGNVFVLEVNPRITGVTPLLTMLWDEGNIPFYLLHILELAGIEYSIEDTELEVPFRDGSMLLLHSTHSSTQVVTALPASGLYDSDAQLINRQIHLQASDNGFLWQQFMPVSTEVKPGGRLLAAFTNGRVLDDKEHLLPGTSEVVKTMLGAVEMKNSLEAQP